MNENEFVKGYVGIDTPDGGIKLEGPFFSPEAIISRFNKIAAIEGKAPLLVNKQRMGPAILDAICISLNRDRLVSW